jgi:hypothetical protein
VIITYGLDALPVAWQIVILSLPPPVLQSFLSPLAGIDAPPGQVGLLVGWGVLVGFGVTVLVGFGFGVLVGLAVGLSDGLTVAGGVVVPRQPVWAGLPLPMPWLRSHS